MKMLLLFALLILLLFTGCQRKTPATEEGEASKLDTSTLEEEEATTRNYVLEDTVEEVQKTTEIDTTTSDDETTNDRQKISTEAEEKKEVFSLFSHVSAEELQYVTNKANVFIESFSELSENKQVSGFFEIESMLKKWEIKVNEAWGACGWIEQDNSKAQELLLNHHNCVLHQFNIPDALEPEQKIFLNKLNEAPFRWFSCEGMAFARVKYLVFQPILETAPQNLSGYIILMIGMNSELVFSDGRLRMPTHNFAELIILTEGQIENEFLSEYQKNSFHNSLPQFIKTYLFGGENTEIWDQEIYNSGYYQIDQEWIDSFRKVLHDHPKSLLASHVQIAYDYLKEHDFNLGTIDKNGFEQYRETVRMSIQEKYQSNN